MAFSLTYEEYSRNLIFLFLKGHYMNNALNESADDFEIIVEDNWVRIRFRSGAFVTNNLIISILKKLYSMDAYRSGKGAGLWNFRGCKGDLDYDKIQGIKYYITRHYDPSWSHTYTAIVADEDLSYGLSRTYEIVTDDVATNKKIFRDMDDAQNWLKEIAA